VIASGRIIACDRPSQLGDRSDGIALVTWIEEGRERQASTGTPTAYVVDLAQRLGGEVPQLSVHRPTLEDTYLSLIAELPGDES
jgi:ABC-2 type transport system ATP-binding protein